MARPSTLPIMRLSHRLWIRAALISYLTAVSRRDVSAKSPPPEGKAVWEWLAHELLGDMDPDGLLAKNMARNLQGIADDGNDPRLQKPYIRVEDVKKHSTYEGCAIVKRRPFGPTPKGETKEEATSDYYEVPIDVVALVEHRLPGTADWASAFVWDLVASEDHLSLEAIREAIGRLLHILKLVRPSLAQRRHCLPAEDYDRFRRVGSEEQKRRYRAALQPITQLGCAHSISLLAALCAESYLADNETLFEIHRDAAASAMENLLSHDLMKEVRHDFMNLVGLRFLDGYTRELNLPEASSLSAPLMHVEDWNAQTGMTWAPVIIL
jgi:hypothetical protein